MRQQSVTLTDPSVVKAHFQIAEVQEVVLELLRPFVPTRAPLPRQGACTNAAVCVSLLPLPLPHVPWSPLPQIFEQAFRFASELRAKGERLSNVVFMGMGEPRRQHLHNTGCVYVYAKIM
jgi:hypothetical protein